MKALSGWLIAYNPDTEKMMPFFMKVRSQDIVSTNPVKIATVLKQISMRWKLTRYEDNCDFTFYEYSGVWVNDSDPNAEVVGNTYSDSVIRYTLYKNGYMTIDGVLRVGGELQETGTQKYMKTLYLPFALPSNTLIELGIANAYTPDVTLVAAVQEDIISNQMLNLDNKDTTKYRCKLKISQVSTDAESSSISVLRTMDPNGGADSYTDYMKNHIPITFKMSAYWKESDGK